MARLLYWTLLLAVVAAACGFRVSDRDNEISLTVDEESSQEHYGHATSQEEEVQAFFQCLPGQDGLFPNPRNCSNFYQCSNGYAHVMPCAKGLHYSDKTQNCEQPCDAYCNRTLSCSCKWPTCDLPRECFLPQETGTCTASIPRYFFNKRTGECERFVYGGCQGNQNNFETKEACEKRCTKVRNVCHLPKEVGPCRGSLPRYFFNKETRQCEKFIYGGCRGNFNNFLTKELCERRCSQVGEESLTEEESSRELSWNEEISIPRERSDVKNVCHLPKEKGPCRANIPRYFFNKETGECEEFAYGGCEGNANNFLNKEFCERTCSQVKNVCHLPKKEGPCRGSFPRYFFNKISGQCEKFIYGGCEGNTNNFLTKEFCERTCSQAGDESLNEESSQELSWNEEIATPQERSVKNVCHLPKERGPCHGYIPRYFFNKETRQCEEFLYGGCQANANNFLTKEICERQCSQVGAESSIDESSHNIYWNEEIAISQEEEVQAFFQCLPEQDGQFPNPRNCSTFIQCSNGYAHVMPCSEGLHYSDKTKQCEQPCDAYCNRTLSCSCKWATCGLPQVCFLPQETGTCHASIPRYFFNKRTGECEKFIYGGCKGNPNNFETKEACERRCTKDIPQECSLPKVTGPCRGRIPRYFFNKKTGECEKFTYGGCKGNKNNFEIKEACEKRCIRENAPEDAVSPADERLAAEFRCPTKDGLFPNPRNCSSFVQCSNGHAHVMPCPAGLHYSEKVQRCQTPCKAFCNRTQSCECKWPTCGLPSMCFLPAKTGPCKAGFQRWFFNKRTGECEKFLYGGCQGNGNNFESKESCQKICKKIRDEPLIEESCEQSGNEETFTSSEIESQSGAESSIDESSHSRYWNEEIAISQEEEVQAFFQCLPEQDGMFRNPRDCSTFIQCSNGYAHVMPCPTGLHYSDKTKRCEQPCDAYCNRTLSCECEWPTCGLPRACFLPQETGTCHASLPRYFFNKRTGECEKFIYGGCNGNQNNFETKEACEQRCTKGNADDELSTADQQFETLFKCPSREEGLFPNPRNCSSFVQCSNGYAHVMPCSTGLHYSDKTKRCEQPCDAYCNRTLSCECKWPTCGLPRACFLEQETGTCHASFPRYFFNKRTGECEKFIYGGCKGNQNNFETKAACEHRCSKDPRCPVSPHPEDCSQFLVRCADATPRALRCPEGRAFDAQLLRCVPGHEARCSTEDSDY